MSETLAARLSDDVLDRAWRAPLKHPDATGAFGTEGFAAMRAVLVAALTPEPVIPPVAEFDTLPTPLVVSCPTCDGAVPGCPDEHHVWNWPAPPSVPSAERRTPPPLTAAEVESTLMRAFNHKETTQATYTPTLELAKSHERLRQRAEQAEAALAERTQQVAALECAVSNARDANKSADEHVAALRKERDEAYEHFHALFYDEPLPNGTYPHLLICNGDRHQPVAPADRNLICNCRNTAFVKKLIAQGKREGGEDRDRLRAALEKMRDELAMVSWANIQPSPGQFKRWADDLHAALTEAR